MAIENGNIGCGGIIIPKAKPDVVYIHRIELQEKERDMLETLVVGKTVKNVVVPVAITAGVVSATYIGYKSAKAFLDWGTDAIDEVKNSYGGMALNAMHNSPSGIPVVGPFVKVGELLFSAFTTSPK
jgi:hypothetical protein